MAFPVTAYDYFTPSQLAKRWEKQCSYIYNLNKSGLLKIEKKPELIDDNGIEYDAFIEVIYLEEAVRFEKEHGIGPNNQSEQYSIVQINENTKVIDSLLKMVITMAIKGYSYNPNDKKSNVTNEIVEDACGLGLSINIDTVRKYLKAGAGLIEQDKI